MTKTIKLKKLINSVEHNFIFTYTEGDESELISSFSDMAARADSLFDWFDAATLTYQVGQRLNIF